MHNNAILLLLAILAVPALSLSGMLLKVTGTSLTLTEVWGFGLNSWGELGNSELTSTTTQSGRPVWAPYTNPYKTDIVGASLCEGFSYYWTEDRLFGQGLNIGGMLGAGEDPLVPNTTHSEPVEIAYFSLNNLKVATIDCHFAVYVTTTDGGIYSWGINEYNIAGLPDATTLYSTPQNLTNEFATLFGSKVTKILTHEKNTMVLTESGAVWTIGYNRQGQLGSNSSVGTSPTFTTLVFESATPAPKMVDIALGGYYGAAVDDAGQLWTWGENYMGILGIPYDESKPPVVRRFPQLVPTPMLYGAKIVQLSALGGYLTALTDDHRVYTTGSVSAGAGGTGLKSRFTDRLREMNTTHFACRAVGIASGTYHNLIRTEKGQVYAAGSNSIQQLGESELGMSVYTPSPIFVSFTHPVVQMKVSKYASILILDTSSAVPETCEPPPEPMCKVQGCVCPPPHPDALCVDGHWILDNIRIDTPIIVESNVTFTNLTLGNGGQIILKPNSNITIDGCMLYRGGSVHVTSSIDEIRDNGFNVTLLQTSSECQQGFLPKVTFEGANQCEMASATPKNNELGYLTAAFLVTQTECPSTEVSNGLPFHPAWFVLIGVGALAVIVGAALATTKICRATLFPYRSDRDNMAEMDKV